MSDAARAVAADSKPASSHVSTAEWQSFEVRMRRRRAQRCLLRAEIALEAGFPDDAQVALEEARRLGTPSEEIERVARSVVAPPPPARVNVHGWLSWKPLAAAIALIAVAAAAASGALLRNTAPARPADAPEYPAVTSASPVQNLPLASSDGLVTGTGGTQPAAASRLTSGAKIEKPSEIESVAERPQRFPSEPRDLETAAIAVPSLPRATPPVPEPAPRAPAESVAPATAPANALVIPKVEPVPDLSLPPPRDESSDVRAVLSRYESAYSQLDLSQARAVWPGVDQRALARAFDGLTSQRLSLGNCDVKMSGSTARATCAGSMAWTPKVGGGGPRTEARRWTFDLKKSGDSWRIERASVR